MGVIFCILIMIESFLTKTIGEPLRLVVVFHSNCASVEEDKNYNEPEPPLLLAHPPNPKFELLKGQHYS